MAVGNSSQWHPKQGSKTPAAGEGKSDGVPGADGCCWCGGSGVASRTVVVGWSNINSMVEQRAM